MSHSATSDFDAAPAHVLVAAIAAGQLSAREACDAAIRRRLRDRRGETELPAMWFLMNEGKRTAVLPHVLGQPPEALDVQLIGWLDDHVFAVGAALAVEAGLPSAEKPHSWRRTRVRGGTEE